MVKETGVDIISVSDEIKVFQSPLGEVVKETANQDFLHSVSQKTVSIPSRGSGKGDFLTSIED